LILAELQMTEVPVWIVDAEHWPRAFLRAELIERGYDATGFATLEDAVRQLRLTRDRRPALLVLDRREQIMDERTSELLRLADIPVLAVADLGHPDGEPVAPLVEVLHRPLTIGDIATAVDRLLAKVTTKVSRR
jgi:hypothetical protein